MVFKFKPKLKRKAKDSVFTTLFGNPEYALQLYKVFHPEDTTATEKELEIITLENVFVDGEYNDLGILMNDRLMLFVEAQSTWNDNMPVRILLYLAETYKRHIMESNTSLLKSGHVTIPAPEAYVIFTGERKDKPDVVRLSEHFPVGDKNFELGENSLELTVKMIYNSTEGDIVYQYINFCKVLDEQRRSYPGDDDAAIRETMRICKKRNILSKFIRDHEPEIHVSISDYLSNQKLQMELYIADEKKAAVEKAVHDKAVETARNLLNMGLSPEQVSQGTSLPLEEVAKLQAELTACANA